jgi:hypothetical protein
MRSASPLPFRLAPSRSGGVVAVAIWRKGDKNLGWQTHPDCTRVQELRPLGHQSASPFIVVGFDGRRVTPIAAAGVPPYGCRPPLWITSGDRWSRSVGACSDRPRASSQRLASAGRAFGDPGGIASGPQPQRSSV